MSQAGFDQREQTLEHILRALKLVHVDFTRDLLDFYHIRSSTAPLYCKAMKAFLCVTSSIFIWNSIASVKGWTTDQGNFPISDPPCLAIITEPDACESLERMEETYEAIKSAVSTNLVDIVSIRVSKPSDERDYDLHFERALRLTSRLVELSSSQHQSTSSSFRVVCSSDWVDVARQAGSHGIHVKEAHLAEIPFLRESFPYSILIGTSTHSVESALKSYKTYQPDYYFVGTCFKTESHPEKSVEDLEGPALPGAVRRAILNERNHDDESSPKTTASATTLPKIMAIGGIDETNCDLPMQKGADGVAVIRSVMQAIHPASVVERLHAKLKGSFVSFD